LTVKAKIITLPKGTLVSFDRPEIADGDGNKLQRTYFLDRTSNGLTVGDRVYEIYYVTKRGKRSGSCIYGDDPSMFPRTEIRERSLTARDIRIYKRAFKRRFKKVVRTARVHRPSAKMVPPISKGLCRAYWKIVKGGRVVSKPIMPDGKKVRFFPAVSIRTKVPENALRTSRVRYDFDKPAAINPAHCASLEAATRIRFSGQSRATRVTVSAGGIGRYPAFLRLLFTTNQFKSRYPSYIQQVGVDYMLGGNQYIHLALNDPAQLALIW